MAQYSYHTTWTTQYICPRCGKIAKTESKTESDYDGYTLIILYTVLLPLTLMYLFIKWIVRLYKDKHELRTNLGERIFFCDYCKSFFAWTMFIEDERVKSGTRILSNDELTKTIVPRYQNNKRFVKRYNLYLSKYKHCLENTRNNY